MQSLLQFLGNNYIELLGFLSALIYIYFSIKQNILLWPWGIITSALYVVVFFTSKLYADMALNVYYVIISIYGWYSWKYSNNNTSELAISKLTPKVFIILLLITLILFIIFSFVLKIYTDSTIPFGDAFITAGSVIATWMLTRKILEQWLFWIVVDFTSMAIYFYKELYFTVILFAVYTVLAIIGYIEWKKEIQSKLQIQ